MSSLDLSSVYDENFQGMSSNEFEEFMGLPENQNKVYELFDGQLVMMAGNVTSNHARISKYITKTIDNCLGGSECEVLQDVNVYLYDENIGPCKNIYQPDIMVGCDKKKMTDKGYEGTPEFVVEIISKSTARYDYFIKSTRYMLYGVKEYWIVDLRKNQILVYLNSDDSPMVSKYTFNDTIEISTFPGISINFQEILKIVSV
jgi:Uma2 family endonuclease